MNPTIQGAFQADSHANFLHTLLCYKVKLFLTVLVIDLTSMATSLGSSSLHCWTPPKVKREKLDVRKPLKGGELLLKSSLQIFSKAGSSGFLKAFAFFWLDGYAWFVGKHAKKKVRVVVINGVWLLMVKVCL